MLRIRDLSNDSNSFNASNKDPKAGERAEILAWLSPLDPRMQHKNLQSMRVDHVGDWFLETEEFRSWYDGSGNRGCGWAALFCCGDSGVGKTFISSLVIDKLCDQARSQSTVVLSFYLDRASQKELSPTDILGSLLKQLVDGLNNIPEEVLRIFRDERMGVGGRALKFAQIAKLFRTITSSYRAIICIDALSECGVKDRLKLLNELREILQKSPGTRLFLTGNPDIRMEIETQLDIAVTVVSITATKGDVISYVRARLDEDPVSGAMDSILEADILERIIQIMPNVLGSVAIRIDQILRETTIFDRRLRLNTMAESKSALDLKWSTPDPLASSSPPRDIHSWNIGVSQPTLLGSSGINLSPTQNSGRPHSARESPQRSESIASYDTCLTSMSQRDSLDRLSVTSSSNIDPTSPIRRGGSLQHLDQDYLTGMPQVASPDQLATAASILASLRYQNASLAQATGYTTDSPGSYFYPNPNNPQPSAIQRQQPASSPQGWGHSPNQNVNNFALSPPLPYQPTHDENQDIEANHLGPGPYVCGCGARIRRPTDLERHLRTSNMHNVRGGLACPEPGCRFTGRFRRVDNFKAHFRRQHKKSNAEADNFIRDWRSQQTP